MSKLEKLVIEDLTLYCSEIKNSEIKSFVSCLKKQGLWEDFLNLFEHFHTLENFINSFPYHGLRDYFKEDPVVCLDAAIRDGKIEHNACEHLKNFARVMDDCEKAIKEYAKGFFVFGDE